MNAEQSRLTRTLDALESGLNQADSRWQALVHAFQGLPGVRVLVAAYQRAPLFFTKRVMMVPATGALTVVRA